MTLLLALILFIPAAAQANDAPRAAVFCVASEYVPYPQIGPEEYGVDVQLFSLAPAERFGVANVDGFVQALARARLLVIGPQQNHADPNTDLIFADAANREAVKGFLKAGGTLAIDQRRLYMEELRKFLAEIGVATPKFGKLPKLKRGQKYTAIGAMAGADARHPLAAKPNALANELNPVVPWAYGTWDKRQAAPVRCAQDPNQATMIVQENVLGAGRVVFNSTGLFSARKSGSSILCENLYSLAFGTVVRRVPAPPMRYRTEEGWALWSKDPYGPFPLNADAPEQMAVQRMPLSAAVNERLSAQVLLTNATEAPAMEMSIVCGELRSGEKALPPVVVRELEFATPTTMYPDRLPETKGFTVASGETRVIWLTVDTFGAEPGEYTGTLALKPADGAARELPLTVRVLPIALPKENPMRFTAWELFFSWRDKLVEDRANWKYYHQDLIDHGASVFHVVYSMPRKMVDAEGRLVMPPEALASLRERIMTRDKRSMYLLHGNIQDPFRVQGKKGQELKYPSPEYLPVYKAYVAEVIRCLKEMGLGYDQFAFYPYDEIPSTRVEYALVNYATIREVDPHAKFFLTLGGHSLIEFFEAKKGRPVKDLAPYVDIWVPGISFYRHFGNLKAATAERATKVVDFCKQTGNEVWSYNVTTRGSYDLAPYQRYRLKPWGAYAMGLTGYSFYGVNQWKKDPFMAIYPGPRPVPSIRWEAVREGMNDVKYMVVLKERIALAKRAGKPTAAAEDLLSRALSEVNKESLDASLAPTYRGKVAAMILELQR